jgi:hypothetical protein
MELGSCNPSDTYNFEVAPRFSENLCTSGIVTKQNSNSDLGMHCNFFYVACPKGVMLVVAFLVILTIFNAVIWHAVTLFRQP